MGEFAGSTWHLAGGFGRVLGAEVAGWAAATATGGEQCSQSVPGIDGAPAAHGPGSGAGVLGCLVFLDTEDVEEVRAPYLSSQ